MISNGKKYTPESVTATDLSVHVVPMGSNTEFKLQYTTNKAAYKILILIEYASSEGSDKSVHSRSLASAITTRTYKGGTLTRAQTNFYVSSSTR